jgi:hypothetical protein
MGHPRLKALVWLIVMLVFAAYVWPTRWRYDHMSLEGNIVLVRMDRFSGEADMLLPDEGWVPVAAPEDSTGAAMPAGL